MSAKVYPMPMGQPMSQPMGEPVVFEQPQSILQRTTPDNMKTGQYAECPPGLEYLTQVDQLLIMQEAKRLENLCGWEMNNKYRIYNTMGQEVYYVAEDTECCMRICFGSKRGFTIHITDYEKKEIMTLSRVRNLIFNCCYRGCLCCVPGCVMDKVPIENLIGCVGESCADLINGLNIAGCAPRCSLDMKIEAPPGNVIGYVGQINRKSCIHPMLSIFDNTHEQIAQIRSPHCCCMFVCPCQSCNEREFSISPMDDAEFSEQNRIAVCSKHWRGMAEIGTDKADFFNLRFPMDMGPKLKATLLGAVIMIDFFFYEG